MTYIEIQKELIEWKEKLDSYYVEWGLCAAARDNWERCLKTKKGVLVLKFEGSVAHKEAKAMESQEYQDELSKGDKVTLDYYMALSKKDSMEIRIKILISLLSFEKSRIEQET